MESRDTPVVKKLLDNINWRMEKSYLDCALKTDSRGFVVAETPSNGIIGFHGFVAHDPSLVNMGMWVVDKDYQNDQVGHQMFEQLSYKFPVGSNIGTFVWPDAVNKIQEQYGIRVKTSYKTWYNYGRINTDTLKPCTDEDFRILPVTDVDRADLLSYDSKIHQIPREEYIQNWIHHEKSRTCIAVRNSKVCGYGVLRSQDSFNQIAPLYADDKHVAKAIFRYLVKQKQGQVIGFSSPLQNIPAIEFAAANNMLSKNGKPLQNIYLKDAINVDTNRVYAVASNSFGNC
ncbi:uncharacterized protein LOC117340916 isoform X2 [Pecten maximus]|uniref:uncharacterized protein LOC117340916 isoform X2 n=1 Tax=Pecten maximus TaxID=6579 RepID=UPI001458149C|nr:uncharacterized protein LOC117340916 isoform X2 [Pecten maximus]